MFSAKPGAHPHNRNRESNCKQAPWSVWAWCVFGACPLTLESVGKPHQASPRGLLRCNCNNFLLNQVALAWCTGGNHTQWVASHVVGTWLVLAFSLSCLKPKTACFCGAPGNLLVVSATIFCKPPPRAPPLACHFSRESNCKQAPWGVVGLVRVWGLPFNTRECGETLSGPT